MSPEEELRQTRRELAQARRALQERRYARSQPISADLTVQALSAVLQHSIPEAMAETGMKKFVMEDGSSIDIKPYYGASIPKARQAEAYQWLRDHGFDDIIKNTVSVRFGRNEDELCVRLLNLLGTQGYPAEQAQKIEPQTLKAWVKERVEKGQPVDTELFGVFIGQKAVIKSN